MLYDSFSNVPESSNVTRYALKNGLTASDASFHAVLGRFTIDETYSLR